jgi:hypothetical protein
MADYSTLDNLQKLSQIVIAILTVGVVIYAQRQVSEAVRSRNQQKTISKHEILLALDARLNSKDLLHLFSYFSQITDFVKGKLKAKDHTPEWAVSITSHPDLRLWLVKQVDLMHIKDRGFFIEFLHLCRVLDTVADLRESGVLTDDEVRAFLGSTLTVFGPLIPDVLVRFSYRDKEAWNFSGRILRLFGLMQSNKTFLEVRPPGDKLEDRDSEDPQHLEFWEKIMKARYPQRKQE